MICVDPRRFSISVAMAARRRAGMPAVARAFVAPLARVAAVAPAARRR
jgi:hypothetical protein